MYLCTNIFTCAKIFSKTQSMYHCIGIASPLFRTALITFWKRALHMSNINRIAVHNFWCEQNKGHPPILCKKPTKKPKKLNWAHTSSQFGDNGWWVARERNGGAASLRARIVCLITADRVSVPSHEPPTSPWIIRQLSTQSFNIPSDLCFWFQESISFLNRKEKTPRKKRIHSRALSKR